MKERISFVKKIWRRFLKWYYRTEKRVLNDRSKRERIVCFFTKLPIQQNKILMDSYNGKGYGDNPKYIAEEILRTSKQKCKIIWLTYESVKNFPMGVTPVNKYSLRAYYESATAKAWVFNCRFGRLTKKRPNQIYLQTWHGGFALKKVEMDAEDKLSSWYLSNAKEDGRVTDGIIVDCKESEDIFSHAFWLNEKCEMLRIGNPRADILINEKNNTNIRNQVRETLGINNDVFFVLYAPTFRKNTTIENYISSFDGILKAFEHSFGKTTIAYRLHPNAIKYMELVDWGNSCSINATEYPDVQELIISADCLITDYSSIAYDFILLRKPVFLCVKDLEEYIEERGVYDTFFQQPFSLNKTEKELETEIHNYSFVKTKKRIEDFYKKYPTYNNGTASREAVKWLKEKGLKL